MSTNVSKPAAKSKWTKAAPLIAIAALTVAVGFPIFMFSSMSAEASSSQNVMQESLSSHGVDVDSVTAERVRRACFQSGAVTTDVIAEFQGLKQVVTVQCGDGDTISDAVVRTLAPTADK